LSVSTLSVILLARQEQHLLLVQWAPISSPSFRTISIVSITHSAAYIASLTNSGPTAPNHSGITLLETALTNSELASCNKLNDGLLQITGQYFKSDITSLMHYFAYNK